MKPHRILLFFLSLFLLLGLVWYFFPADGLPLGKVTTLRFPSFEGYLRDMQDTTEVLDLDQLLSTVQESYEIPDSTRDTLSYYRDFLRGNPNRIHLPQDNYAFFDTLFRMFETAVDSAHTVRILHYGDSQLEMDRISAVLRENLQQRFGGSGPGMVPPIQPIPTVSLTQRYGGGFTRYAMVGDSLTRHAAHHRYGPMTQFVSLSGKGSFLFKATKNRFSQPLARQISKVSVLAGRTGPGFRATLRCDTLPARRALLDAAPGVSLLSWELPGPVESGSITFEGTGEIYGVMLDAAEGGVAVDNVALRGCAGTIFTTIDSTVLARSLALTNVRLIILQFGGNAMPGIGSLRSVSAYMKKIDRQIGYFRQVAPKAQLLFVGPADMGKSVRGRRVSWPLLQELNDSLRVHCLDHDVAYWDTFGMMGGSGSMARWVQHSPPLAGPDYIHFTHRGAQEVGDALSRSLLTCYDFYLLRRAFSDEAIKSYMEEE